MSVWDRVIVAASALELVAGGMSKSQAVASAASTFNRSERVIWKHGVFKIKNIICYSAAKRGRNMDNIYQKVAHKCLI